MGCDPNLLQEFSESSIVSSMANVCCSIELEPRTLSQGQISQARVKSLPHGQEVAADIIQNKEPNEVSNIFVEGLKPVASIKDMVFVVQEIETLDTEDEAKDKINNITEATCQCLCTPSTIDSPDQSPQLKEPLSAPF